MGRPHGTTHWHITMPTDLANRIDLLTIDSLTGRAKYGARQQLIERLLREYLAREFPSRQSP